jgi:hypothetical protein
MSIDILYGYIVFGYVNTYFFNYWTPGAIDKS